MYPDWGRLEKRRYSHRKQEELHKELFHEGRTFVAKFEWLLNEWM